MSWKRELQTAKEAAVKAGKAIMEIYQQGDFEISLKSDESPLTIADKKANEIIVNLLRKEFPLYAVLSEEEKDNLKRLNNDYCFVVDPLDGTKEFIKRNGQFTVNIALSFRGKSVMGVIYVPVTETLYFATQGSGAYCICKDDIRQIQVSDRTEDIRVVMSSSHGCPQMDSLIAKNNLHNYVKMGSSLKGCLIAEGKAEIYYRFNPTMEWDTAAMQCIVEEAGAIFRQMDDSEMQYNRSDSLNSKGFYIINCVQNKMKW